MKRRVVVILAGLPGCGKSTLRGQILGIRANEAQEALPAWSAVSTDDEVEAHAKALGKTYSEVWSSYVEEAEKRFWHKLRSAVEFFGDEVIFVDRTNLTKKGRAKIMNFVRENGGKDVVFVALHVFCSGTEIKARRAARVGKEIPEDVIDKMRLSIQTETYGEGFSHIWNVDTSTNPKADGTFIAHNIHNKWTPKYIYERLVEITQSE